MLRSICLITTIAVVAFQPFALADTLVAPNALANNEGSGSNAFPFVGGSSSGSGGIHYQQVFAASQFASINSPALITAITFRPEAGQMAKSFGYIRFSLTLSTTPVQPDALSTTFANNVGADKVTVYNGPITLSTNVAGPTKGPQAFDINIPFQTGFVYQPTQGNLLFDLTLSIPTDSGTGIVLDSENTTGDSISRLIAVSGVDDLGSGIGRASTIGVPTLFTYTVPEPSSAALCTAMVFLSCLWVKRRSSAQPTRAR